MEMIMGIRILNDSNGLWSQHFRRSDESFQSNNRIISGLEQLT
uniref:Uncharacterized protein n=1 Tax=Anguilla anguilla TaxID=7936 RepID=A0A0E9PA41_ANGAN